MLPRFLGPHPSPDPDLAHRAACRFVEPLQHSSSQVSPEGSPGLTLMLATSSRRKYACHFPYRQACWYRGLRYNGTAMPEASNPTFLLTVPILLDLQCGKAAVGLEHGPAGLPRHPRSLGQRPRAVWRSSVTALHVLGRRPRPDGLVTVTSNRGLGYRMPACPLPSQRLARSDRQASCFRKRASCGPCLHSNSVPHIPGHWRAVGAPARCAPRTCSCHGRLDQLGDHRSACAMSGFLAAWAFPHLSRDRSTSTAERAGCRHDHRCACQ